jgi:D-alanine-D-alanine ligase
MTAARKVAVLKGGGSLERSVSLRSGARAQSALSRLGHEVVALDVGPDLLAQLHDDRPDAAFVALHGRVGEDGIVQGLLETIGLPYTGSGPAACMRATDKALAKYLMREADIPTPAFASFTESAVKDLGVAAALGDIERSLGFPMVVKPATGGSALGVKFARSGEELPGAIVGALSYDRKVVIERYVAGRDLAVSVLGCPPACLPVLPKGSREGEPDPGDAPAAGAPIALPVVEAIPREEDFYNYESRYEIGMTTFVCPAELPPETTARAQELAVQVYTLLGCHGVARVDLMLDSASDELFVLETNVVPGLTETSLLPLAADAAGIDFDELIERILASAWTRQEAVVRS